VRARFLFFAEAALNAGSRAHFFSQPSNSSQSARRSLQWSVGRLCLRIPKPWPLGVDVEFGRCVSGGPLLIEGNALRRESELMVGGCDNKHGRSICWNDGIFGVFTSKSSPPG
jgi:hypothetical protein